jgi:hypothetical protein
MDGSFTNTANWSTGSVPTTSDVIVFDGTGTFNLTSNLDQHTVAFGSIIVYQASTVQIGSIVGGVRTYLQHAAPNVYIGQRQGSGAASGSELLMFDSGGTSCTYAIFDSSSQASIPTLPPIQLIGSALTVDMSGGNFGAACQTSEVATLAALTISLNGNGGLSVSPAQAYIGVGATVTALTMNAGTVLDQRVNACTAATVNGGTYTYQGTGDTTTLSVNSGAGTGGQVFYSGTGTIGTLNQSGTFDRSQDGRSVTVTNWNIYSGATINLNNGVSGSTVRTNPPALIACSMQNLNIQTNVGELF